MVGLRRVMMHDGIERHCACVLEYAEGEVFHDPWTSVVLYYTLPMPILSIMNTQHPTPNTQHPLVLGSCMVALLAAVVLVACRKDTVPAPVPADVAMAGGTVTPRVQAFIAQARGESEVKLGSAMSADSVEWYVEAALNYSLAKAWLECQDLVADSAWASVPLGSNGVPYSSAFEAFNALYDALSDVNEDGVRHLAIVDVVARPAGAELRLEARYLVGSNYTKSVNASYGANDAWLWGGYSACNCGPNTVSSDVCAHKRIQDRVREAVLVAMGPNDYWTSVETWYINELGPDIPNRTYHWEDFPNSNNTSGNSNQDYWTYACVDYNCSTCLESDDMSHHTQGTYDALMWIRSNHCPTKTPYTATVDWEMGVGMDPLYFHRCSFTYGIKQSGSSS